MHAYLADTGFAKAAQAQRGGLSLSSRRGPCYTPGYADPIIINGGEYSAVTDAYAVGITLLVCMTGRSPIALFDELEEVTLAPALALVAALALTLTLTLPRSSAATSTRSHRTRW